MSNQTMATSRWESGKCTKDWMKWRYQIELRYVVCCGSTVLDVLSTNTAFAESFDGENPIYPVGGIISIDNNRYRIIEFRHLAGVIEVDVELI